VHPHRFDALSAALGVLCLAAAGAVATNALLTTDSYLAGWWVAVGALVLGLGLLPWPGRRAPSPDAAAADGFAGSDDGRPAEVETATSEPSTGSA
jgi:hypothetical protein